MIYVQLFAAALAAVLVSRVAGLVLPNEIAILGGAAVAIAGLLLVRSSAMRAAAKPFLPTVLRVLPVILWPVLKLVLIRYVAPEIHWTSHNLDAEATVVAAGMASSLVCLYRHGAAREGWLLWACLSGFGVVAYAAYSTFHAGLGVNAFACLAIAAAIVTTRYVLVLPPAQREILASCVVFALIASGITAARGFI